MVTIHCCGYWLITKSITIILHCVKSQNTHANITTSAPIKRLSTSESPLCRTPKAILFVLLNIYHTFSIYSSLQEQNMQFAETTAEEALTICCGSPQAKLASPNSLTRDSIYAFIETIHACKHCSLLPRELLHCKCSATGSHNYTVWWCNLRWIKN